MVISMLTIGALALVSFIVVEWKFAKLPMMPSKFPFHIVATKIDGLTSR